MSTAPVKASKFSKCWERLLEEIKTALIRDFLQEYGPYLKTEYDNALRLNFLILFVKLKVKHWLSGFLSYFFFCLILRWSN